MKQGAEPIESSSGDAVRNTMFRRAGQSLSMLTLALVLVPVGASGGGEPRVDIHTTRLGELAGAVTATVPVGAGQMVALDWASGDLDHVELSVRTGSGWSNPVELAANPDEGPDPGSPEASGTRLGLGPVWVGEDATAVRVRVDHGRARDLRVRELHSVEPEPGPFSISGAAAAPANPGVRSRADWGADESIRNANSGCENSPTYADNVHLAFVHHTVSTNSYAANEADDLIRGIYAFHVRSRGWCDIGYNFLVDRHGGMWEGRAGGIERAVIGAHAGGYNTGSTGVALLGDHRTAGVTTATRAAVADLLAWKLAHHGVDPANRIWMNGVLLHTISGHRDVSATACPGDRAYALLPGLRTDLAQRLRDESPYPMAGYTPQDPGQAPALAVLGKYGSVVPKGSADSFAAGPFWKGWPVARALALTSREGGYLIDAWGGVHALGDAPRAVSPRYRPGTDHIRGAAPVPGAHGGMILDAFGGITPFGNAPGLLPRDERWPGWDIARGIVVAPDGAGGYLVDGWGGLHRFGTVPRFVPSGYWQGWDIARGVGLLPDGSGGWVLDGWGGLHAFGDAPGVKPSSYTPQQDRHRGIVVADDGKGGWTVDVEGRLHPFGNAPQVRQPGTWSGFNVGRAVGMFPDVDPGVSRLVG